jgi:hypothetical protein
MLINRCPGDSAIIDVSSAAIKPNVYTRTSADSFKSHDNAHGCVGALQ